jgi:AraC-like DNA-binding protein
VVQFAQAAGSSCREEFDMSIVLSTESVAPRERVAFWQEMVCQSFVQAQCGSAIGEAFFGRISTESFGDTLVSRMETGRQRIDRRRSDIATCNMPRYYLCYQAAGRARVVERHSDSVVGAGDMILLDNSEPYSFECEDDVTTLVLQVPHKTLQDRFRHPDRCTGRTLTGQRGITRITGDFLTSCAAQADALTESQRVLTSQVALNLFTAMLLEESNGDSNGTEHRMILMARIKQFVLSRIGDPGLNLDAVARGVGLSTRYVSKLFQEDGVAFTRYLLRERVEHCRRELSDPLLHNLRISDIALRGGFNNLSHFSRAFRDSVGRSPTEYRAEPKA